MERTPADGRWASIPEPLRPFYPPIPIEDGSFALPCGVRVTPREGDVLLALGGGLEVPQIAERLSVTESAVKQHLQHLRDKTGLTTPQVALLGLLIRFARSDHPA